MHTIIILHTIIIIVIANHIYYMEWKSNYGDCIFIKSTFPLIKAKLSSIWYNLKINITNR